MVLHQADQIAEIVETTRIFISEMSLRTVTPSIDSNRTPPESSSVGPLNRVSAVGIIDFLPVYGGACSSLVSSVAPVLSAP